MKILYLTPGVFDKGGIARYCRYQIQAIRERFGPESIKVFSVRGPGCAEFEFEDPFHVAWAGKKPDNFNRILFGLHSALEALVWKPNLVLTAHVNLSWLGLTLARWACAKSILNAYGLEIWSGLNRLRVQGLRYHDLIISDCHNTADYIQTTFHRKTPTSVVWDPVDLSRYFPKPKSEDLFSRYNIPRAPGFRYIMTLGRVSVASRHKGVERIIQVFSNLKDVPDIHYIIAGDGDDRARLEKLVADSGMTSQIHFIGSIPENDLADVYNLCDIFVLISDIGPNRGEGIPMTPMEAGACGKPVFVGNQDGSREIIEQGNGGYIFDPFDFSAIQEKIRQVCFNDDLRDLLSIQIQNRIQKTFSYEIFAQKTISALEKLL